jgi:hypothetical protein
MNSFDHLMNLFCKYLLKTVHHFKALVHVSTCYFRLDHDELNEELYVPPVLPQKLIDSVDQMSPDQLEALTAK